MESERVSLESRSCLESEFKDSRADVLPEEGRGLLERAVDVYFKPKFFEKKGTLYKYFG